MKQYRLAAAALVIAVAVACSRSQQPAEPRDDAPEDMSQMPEPSAPASQTHIAQGTINRIDREQGRVNISHEAVASASWPAMTMDFEVADPGIAADLKEGQRVTFRFKTGANGRAVVEMIEPTQ